MKTSYKLSVLIVHLPVFMACAPMFAGPAIGGDGFVPIFNGRNLDGWHVVLRKDDDPELKQQVFAVEDGVVHVFKGIPAGFDADAQLKDRRTNGAMFTDRSYTNYVFRFEYKWGGKTVNSPQQHNYNDGCFYHVTRDSIWPQAIEYQIRYDQNGNRNHTGDLIPGGNTFTWYAADGNSATFLSPSEGGQAIKGRSKGFSARPVELAPERAFDWNRCEIIVMGSQYAIHKFNGAVVNMVSDLSVGAGMIGLQAEFGEIFYRNMEIKEFKEPVPIETFMER